MKEVGAVLFAVIVTVAINLALILLGAWLFQDEIARVVTGEGDIWDILGVGVFGMMVVSAGTSTASTRGDN